MQVGSGGEIQLKEEVIPIFKGYLMLKKITYSFFITVLALLLTSNNNIV